MANPLTREAVLKAIAEFDRLGRPAFLERHGYGEARDYFLVVAGRNYDSKAIAGVAYGYLKGGSAKAWNEHTGGITDAAAKLEELGFTITKPGENPDWTWDEHVLALELYLTLKGSRFSQQSAEVAELSELLNRLGKKRGLVRTPKYRNANGVYKKLMNFRAVDPDDPAKGLKNGSKLESKVWDAYRSDELRLRADAKLIRLAIEEPGIDLGIEDEDEGVAEGDIIYRLHKFRERAPGLAAKKRREVLNATGALCCEVCDVDFNGTFAGRGVGALEVHHISPIALSKKGRKTKTRDLALVCANCHRMLHRGGLISIEQLRCLLVAPHSAPAVVPA